MQIKLCNEFSLYVIIKMKSKAQGPNLDIMLSYEISCIIIFKNENLREMENILIMV